MLRFDEVYISPIEILILLYKSNFNFSALSLLCKVLEKKCAFLKKYPILKGLIDQFLCVHIFRKKTNVYG